MDPEKKYEEEVEDDMELGMDANRLRWRLGIVPATDPLPETILPDMVVHAFEYKLSAPGLFIAGHFVPFAQNKFMRIRGANTKERHKGTLFAHVTKGVVNVCFEGVNSVELFEDPSLGRFVVFIINVEDNIMAEVLSDLQMTETMKDQSSTGTTERGILLMLKRKWTAQLDRERGVANRRFLNVVEFKERILGEVTNKWKLDWVKGEPPPQLLKPASTLNLNGRGFNFDGNKMTQKEMLEELAKRFSFP